MESQKDVDGASCPSRCSSARPLVIYATEIEKQPDELIEDVRNGLSHLRGQLGDIARAYGWEDRIGHNQSAITVLLISLAYAMDEIKEFRRKNGDLQWRTR